MNKQQNYLTVIHTLRLTPVWNLQGFAADDVRAYHFDTGPRIALRATPGTIEASMDSDDWRLAKQITMRVPMCDPEGMQQLEALTRTELLADYIDGTGRHRLFGSPAYPARLSYMEEGGALVVTLTCHDTVPDRQIDD